MAYCEGSIGEARANARLIAAASDLLEACKRLLLSVPDGMIMPAGADPNVDAARAAITKATAE